MTFVYPESVLIKVIVSYYRYVNCWFPFQNNRNTTKACWLVVINMEISIKLPLTCQAHNIGQIDFIPKDMYKAWNQNISENESCPLLPL